MNASPSTVIYPAQSILTLVSRAWDLFRANMKNSVLIMLPPVIMLTLLSMLSSQLSSHTFLTPTSKFSLGLQLINALLVLLLSIPSFFLWTFSSCVLSRYYFSVIVGEKPLTIKDCLRYVLRNWLKLMILAVVLGLCMAVLVVINVIIMYLGIFLSIAVIALLGISAASLGGGMAMAVLFLLVWGFAVLTVAITLCTFQGFFFVFPMLSFSTDPQGKTSLWPLVKHAYQLLFDNMPRLIVFALALFLLSLAFMSVLMTPIWIWVFVELSRLGLSQQHFLPLHVQVGLNIWNSLSQLILTPFYIGATTLLWYDCQVRKEGLDLKLWLNQLIRRHGGQPQEFNTLTDPQPT